MKKLLFFLSLLGLLAIFVSACSDNGGSIPDEPEEYLTVQLRADAGNTQMTLEWRFLPAADTYNIYYLEDDGSNEQPHFSEIEIRRH